MPICKVRCIRLCSIIKTVLRKIADFGEAVEEANIKSIAEAGEPR